MQVTEPKKPREGWKRYISKSVLHFGSTAFDKHVAQQILSAADICPGGDVQGWRAWECRAPGTGCRAFRVICYPWHLIIQGDVGFQAFSRLYDMIEFVSGGALDDPHYLAGKSILPHSAVWQWSESSALESVRDWRKELTSEAAPDEDGAVDRDAEQKLVAIDWEELESSCSTADAFHDAMFQADRNYDYETHEGLTADFEWCYMALRWFVQTAKPERLKTNQERR